MSNPNTPEYWDQKWAREWGAYARDPRRDALYREILSRLSPAQVILDVGGGCSRFARLATAAGHSVYVLDHSRFAIEHLAEHGILGAAVDLDRWDGKVFGEFDAVVCTECLEHLEHPERAVALACAHAPRAYYSVPNDRMGPTECAEHLRVYDPPALLGLLGRYYRRLACRDVAGYLLAEATQCRNPR